MKLFQQPCALRRFFALCTAAALLLSSGCSGQKKDAAEPDAYVENAFGEQAVPPQSASNKPSSSNPPLEAQYAMPEGMEAKYTLHTLLLAADDGAEHGVEPFEISFILPAGWTVGEKGERVIGSFQDVRGEGSPLFQGACFIDNEGRLAAALSFAGYDAEAVGDIEKDYARIYEKLMTGSYRFLLGDSYHPFYSSTASNLTAATKTRYDRADGAIQYNPAVLSVDPERGVYIAVEFAIGRINAIQFMDFAESICIY